MLRALLLACLMALPCCASETLLVVPDLYAPAGEDRIDASAAEAVFSQAADAAEQGQSSVALQLATQTLRLDPNHPIARRVLGYQPYKSAWLTPFQAKQQSRGFTWDARFGWVQSADLPRYEQGERKQGRRWLSVQEDSAQHSRIDQGWQVRTDHFLVTTNHSLEAGARLAAQLEQLFQVWRQLFAGYHLGDAEIKARFTGTRNARSRSRPFHVLHYRSQDEYIAALRHKQPRIDQTLGIYFDDLRQAHFFAKQSAENESPNKTATLYHEAIHQLFSESLRTRREVGQDHGFWLVEGIACYFESLQPRESPGTFSIGSAHAGRLPAARHRLLVDDFYVPLAELDSLGKLDLQRRSDLAPLYSQMAGLATYLMHGESRKLREPLVGYLKALYQGKARPGDLFQQLDRTPAQLDAGYRKWLQSLPE